MSLADKFLKQGVKVILIDVAGHESAQVKPYQTLACDIMHEACDSNNYPHFIDAHQKVHPDIMDAISIDPTADKESSPASLRLDSGLSEKQLEEIDEELRRYDCKFRSIVGHENMTVLYDTAFSKNMNGCDDLPFISGKDRWTRKDMWTVISSWADPMHDMKASLRASSMFHKG